jgi:hypothetical protein
MTREIAAEPVLAADQFALLVLHRLRPEYDLSELIARSARVGDPIRRSMFHLAACTPCTADALEGAGPPCARGARLAAACAGWRPRGDGTTP